MEDGSIVPDTRPEEAWHDASNVQLLGRYDYAPLMEMKKHATSYTHKVYVEAMGKSYSVQLD